jgi:hypothetical protein
MYAMRAELRGAVLCALLAATAAAAACGAHGVVGTDGRCECDGSWCHVDAAAPDGACSGADARYADCYSCPAGARVVEGACAPCPAETAAAAANATRCELAPLASCDEWRAAAPLASEHDANDLISAPSSACAVGSSWSAPLALGFGRRCELHDMKLTPTCTWAIAERKALGCPCGARLDGLAIRYGRTDAEDLDLYDFRPRCAGRAMRWAGLAFRARERTAAAALECSSGEAVTGIEVTYARYEWGDADLYDFRLRCAGTWAANSSALHVGARRRRPSALRTGRVECAAGEAACGLEVTRARQDDGDVDQLDLRLRCTAVEPPVAAAAMAPELESELLPLGDEEEAEAEAAAAAEKATAAAAAADEPPPPVDAAAATAADDMLPPLIDAAVAGAAAEMPPSPADAAAAAVAADMPPPPVDAAVAAAAADTPPPVDAAAAGAAADMPPPPVDAVAGGADEAAAASTEHEEL